MQVKYDNIQNFQSHFHLKKNTKYNFATISSSNSSLSNSSELQAPMQKKDEMY